MSKSIVYYLKDCTPENVVKAYEALKYTLPGKVAIKVHSGEDGNPNFLGPDFIKPLVEKTKGVPCEANTAYEGARITTEKHLKLLEKHRWSVVYPNFDLLDANPSADIEVQIPEGKKIKKNYIGEHMINYDSMLVFSHFKGHQMGGFGGALKQLSIGCGSTAGKCYIHSAGVTEDPKKLWQNIAKQDDFCDSMADAALSVINFYRGRMAYVNVMKNISIDCDCNGKASKPELPDMGIFASLDPVAIDQACYDKIANSNEKGKEAWLKRASDKHGLRTIETAAEHRLGKREYEIINLD